MKILFIDNIKFKNIKYSLKDVGNNYGNLLFYFATLEILKNNEIFHTNIDSVIEPDVIVITTANCICNIQSCIDYVGYLSNIIKKYKCKKIIYSIGAQSDNLELYKLNENSRKNIFNLFQQVDIINLRGKYTHDLLLYNELNFKYVINGCPSIYMCKKISFDINQILNKTNTKILFNTPRYDQKNISFFNELCKCEDIDHLYQDVLFGCKYPNIKYLCPEGFDIWKEIVMDYDFIIGTRIHGCIMGLICNKPSLLIAIDSRTLELAEELNIPHINNINNKLILKTKDDIINLFSIYFSSYNIVKFNKSVLKKKKIFDDYII